MHENDKIAMFLQYHMGKTTNISTQSSNTGSPYQAGFFKTAYGYRTSRNYLPPFNGLTPFTRFEDHTISTL